MITISIGVSFGVGCATKSKSSRSIQEANPGISTMQAPKEIADHVRAELRLGFATRAEVIEAAVELFGDAEDYPGDAVVARLVEDAHAALLAEQRTWTRPTDVEKLDAAFKRLNRRGILARHAYAPTRTWGRGDLDDEAKDAAAQGVSAHGYVYYTTEDAEAVLGGELMLAHGNFHKHGNTLTQHALEGARVARAIVDELQGAGLTVAWTGELGETIRVRDLDWKAPRDETSGRSLATNEAATVGPPLERAAVAASPRPSEPPPWPVTGEDEWWFVGTFISFDGSNAPDVALDIVHASLRGETKESARRGPGVLDFAFGGMEVAGRKLRFDLLAADAFPLSVSNRRDKVRAADFVVAIVRDPQEDLEALADLPEWLEGKSGPTDIFVLLDKPARSAKADLKKLGYPIFDVDLEGDFGGVLGVLKAGSNACVLHLKQALSN